MACITPKVECHVSQNPAEETITFQKAETFKHRSREGCQGVSSWLTVTEFWAKDSFPFPANSAATCQSAWRASGIPLSLFSHRIYFIIMSARVRYAVPNKMSLPPPPAAYAFVRPHNWLAAEFELQIEHALWSSLLKTSWISDKTVQNNFGIYNNVTYIVGLLFFNR